MSRVFAADTIDVRFPTSTFLDGSDAMNRDPDYSAAYLRVRTDADDGLEGHGFVFTIGRGNDAQTAAIRTVVDAHLIGRPVEPLLADMGGAWRELVHDSQLRWLGPEKGAMHMAIGAVINALWDLKAKRAGLPLWQLLAGLSREEIVDLVDFRYLTDALTPGQAREMLAAAEPGRADRVERLLAEGYPAYTTSPGWLGYDDEKLDRLCREAVATGFGQVKLKIGANLADDRRRLAIARAACGPEVALAVDANQRWDVDERSRGFVRSKTLTWPGWRSQPVPTTCSVTRPSPAASRPSRWPPGSTWPTGCWPSSSCRRKPARCCRSTPLGWPG